MIPINKYLAQAGVCSRRKAIELIKSGSVKINGLKITEPGHKVAEDDVVKVGRKIIRPQKKVYLLLNKPAGYITTHSDEKGRHTVFDLVKSFGNQRLHAIGRLDKNTTGLILLTTDGDLTQQLAHPKYEIQKTYVATLDKQLRMLDIAKIKKGIRLKDGKIVVDRITQTGPRKAKIALHSGKYRVIRRLFKKLGYNVLLLDRINYAGLTKKGLKPAQWRTLTAAEVKLLKATPKKI